MQKHHTLPMKKTMKTYLLKPLFVIASLGFLPIATSYANDVAPQKIKFIVHSFSIEGDDIKTILSEDEISAYFKPFQEKSYDLKELQTVSKGLETILRDEGYAFYRVILPPQSLNSGAVKLKVIAFGIENINIEGNQNFSNQNVLASLPELEKGVSPNTKDLTASLKMANKHPSKQATLIFKQSETKDKLDALVNVTEQPRPYKFTLDFNNTGSDTSGEYRLTAGAQYSNLWGRDHIVNASYTRSPDQIDAVEQYGGTYALPIYALNGWVNMYYAKSSSNNGVVATDLKITGAGEMMGIHYQQFLPKFEKYEHSVDIGLDSRYFSNNIQLQNSTQNSQFGSNVRSAPFSISYKAEYPFEHLQSGYFVQWSINTGLGSDNNDSRYASTGGNSSWQLFRYGTNFLTNYEQWTLSTSLMGQQSQNHLIAGEQLGLAGSFDVRGYEQREVSADSGQIVKVELTAPAWEKINAFVFYDYAHGTTKNLSTGTKEWNLSGTGVGAKWAWREYVNTSLTFATALNDANTTKAFDNRILLNVNLRY